MSRRYSYDSDPGERVPLDNHNDSYAHHHQQPGSSSRHDQSQYYQQQYQQQHQQDTYQDYPPPAASYSPPRNHDRDPRHDPSSRPTNRPGAHPDSTFGQLRENRRRSAIPAAAAAGAAAGAGAYAAGADYSSQGPSPPTHRSEVAQNWSRDQVPPGYGQSPTSTTTPGADNFSESAAGGMQGLALSVADRHPRESGVEAMRDYSGQGSSQYPYGQHQQPSPPQRQASPYDHQQDYGQDRGYYDHSPGYGPQGGYGSQGGYGGGPHDGPYDQAGPHLTPIGAAAFPSGRNTPTRSNPSMYSYSSDPFSDHHPAYGQRMDPRLGEVNPNEIDDDGDDGLDYRRPARNSMLSLGNSSNGGRAAAAVAGAAAAGGLMSRSHNSGANYNPVNNPGTAYTGAGGSSAAEKSAWLAEKTNKKKRWKWVVIILVGIIIIGAIVGGILGGVVFKNGGSSSSSSGGNSGQSADEDTEQNGDLNINSQEIKDLMNNPDLHKVFPGVDYTPLNVQYPECLETPPSQNNVTRDVAVLSQLTNVIRLYGTDCNQTQMVIHAIDQLELTDDVKIWMGVWQDGNTTTNKRQLNQMWTILDDYGADYFKGVIVANEILFREQMTITELGTLLQTVRTNLTSHGWDLPVATSDLGTDWDSSLADASDYIMANIHPFFGGVPADQAANWTHTFWNNHASTFFKSDNEKNVIAEIGWPTKGGTNCGTDGVTDCGDNGAVASIDGLNQLLEDWVCQSLEDSVNYFWFEMFDEPWKISFNEDGKEWEDQWGIMDVNRNLKSGVTIPDCGGKTV